MNTPTEVSMFSHEADPLKAAQEYIDKVGTEIKAMFAEVFAANDMSQFSLKLNAVEKYRDEILNGAKYREAENIIKPPVKVATFTYVTPSLTTGSFISDMNRLPNIEKTEPDIDSPRFSC